MKTVLRYIIWFMIVILILVIGVADAGFDLPALNAQVQTQQVTLANHEARITNNENDIKSLQDNTNTPPAEHVIVTPAPQPPSQPAITPDPVPQPDPVVTQSSTDPTTPHNLTTTTCVDQNNKPITCP